MFKCLTCNKSFNSALALAGHKRMHGNSNGKINPILVCCLITKEIMPYQYLERHQSKLKPCKHCQYLFKPTAQRKTFCGQSCSASFNNLTRPPRSTESRAKTSKSMTKTAKKIKESKPKKVIPEVVGPFNKLYLCSCNHCHVKFVSRKKVKYCSSHKELYSAGNKQGYKFTFNIYHYPDLFDLDLLNKVGFFAPGGKSGKWNIDGLSRDHKISVTESITNQYDPYYITHPLNCELMPHSDNNKKKTKSSITYEELKSLVHNYDLSK